jgi:hypothetical protein
VKFTIELGTQQSVRFQALDQGLLLTRSQLSEMDDLDTQDISLSRMLESGTLTESQVKSARKRLLRQMLAVIGGAS